ncbi:hypothetical protein AAVH_27675 [Aphelenchoides avenae]|nr:hypothetical protein AAVH_27675 [Aphelenchus avenae]
MTTPNSTLDFVVESQDYVRNVFPRTDGKCMLQLVVSALDVEYGWWRLGTSATKNYCWNFNYETNKMSVTRSTLD